MSKKRKTKKEKMTAAIRHDYSTVLTLSNTSPTISSINIENAISKSSPSIGIPTSQVKSYSYVAGDVKKTITITSALIALNIVFYTILKLKLINLFGIVF